jgi:hypothetical protein
LRSKGWSYWSIAKAIKVAKSTLIKWNKDFEDEISERRAEHLNDLRDIYHVSEIHRVELFGKRLKSIKAEIQTKGLTELKIGQLLAMEVKYANLLKE